MCEKFVVLKYRVKQVSERSYPANFIEKIDEFINLPRGFGKSLTYQALPLICETVRGTTGHIVVVVSPLVNLMKDQATKLANIGIFAVTLSDIREENMKAAFRVNAVAIVIQMFPRWRAIVRGVFQDGGPHVRRRGRGRGI